MARAGSDNKHIIGHALAVQQHFPSLDIDPRHLSKQDPHIAVSAEQAANGCGNIGGRQSGCSDLVQQWLE
jgi:hypothetical protein